MPYPRHTLQPDGNLILKAVDDFSTRLAHIGLLDLNLREVKAFGFDHVSVARGSWIDSNTLALYGFGFHWESNYGKLNTVTGDLGELDELKAIATFNSDPRFVVKSGPSNHLWYATSDNGSGKVCSVSGVNEVCQDYAFTHSSLTFFADGLIMNYDNTDAYTVHVVDPHSLAIVETVSVPNGVITAGPSEETFWPNSHTTVLVNGPEMMIWKKH